MMRTIEILLVIIIMLGAFLTTSYFAILPPPRTVSPLNLKKLALTTLQTLDAERSLSETVFKNSTDPAWGQLQIALSACLPTNIIYNLTVYDTQSGSGVLYRLNYSISNAESVGATSLVSSYLVTSSNATFRITPQKINNTLYILNCSDSNGWWITGYTAQSLAEDVRNLLNPYFKNESIVIVNDTSQLGKILNGSSLVGETIRDAIVINTFGETIPIPDGYYSSPGVGFDTGNNSYARYCHTLGSKVRLHNWTWVSIVGYPFYYVSNTMSLKNSHNSWGIFGMVMVGNPGLQAFLQGLDNQTYCYGNSQTGSPGVVYLSSVAQHYCNEYGIYPSAYQTSTRALNVSMTSTYHLNITTYIFDKVGDWVPGAVYRNTVSGGFMALGLTRTPDIRLTALGLLCDYKPALSKSEYTVAGTSKLIVLQLGNAGGT
jgi:hypothetical protein